MKIDSLALETNDILKMLSKTEPNYYCVFIQPNGIVESDKDMIDLKLNCTESNLVSENLILEIYDNKAESENRVNDFEVEYKDYYYVACYKNGKFICDNQ